VLDKCLKEDIKNPSLWTDLCWRAQQICHHLSEPFSLYIFRAFSRGDWYDHYFFLTFLGKMQQRLLTYRLRDCAYVVEAMCNPKFRENRFVFVCLSLYFLSMGREDTKRGSNSMKCNVKKKRFLQNIFEHAQALLTHRSDISTEDICYFLGALRFLEDPPVSLVIKMGESLRQRDLRCIKFSYRVEALEAFASIDFSGSKEILDTLVQTLKNEYKEASLSEIIRMVHAFSQLQIKDRPFFRDLRERVLPLRYKLKPQEIAPALYGFAKGDVLSPLLSQELEIGVCEFVDKFSPVDLCLSVSGFLMGPPADKVLGILIPRLRLQLKYVPPSSLVLLFDGLTRTKFQVK
ncbi:hypothetical protein IE077_002576, partial [Cardiosporidium cionae]